VNNSVKSSPGISRDRWLDKIDVSWTISVPIIRDLIYKMGTEMVLETSFLYRYLMRLIAGEDFIKFSHCESSRSYIKK